VTPSHGHHAKAHDPDTWQQRRWTAVFVWIGANAITLYLLHNVMQFKQVATRLVGGDLGAFLDQALRPGAGKFLAAATGFMLAIGPTNVARPA
jgi:hypothetical protein